MPAGADLVHARLIAADGGLPLAPLAFLGSGNSPTVGIYEWGELAGDSPCQLPLVSTGDRLVPTLSLARPRAARAYQCATQPLLNMRLWGLLRSSCSVC